MDDAPVFIMFAALIALLVLVFVLIVQHENALQAQCAAEAVEQLGISEQLAEWICER